MPASWIDRLSLLATRRVMWLLGVVFLMLFGIFQIAAARLNTLSANTPMIDMHIYYTPAEVYKMVAAYGPEGRSLHILTTLTADLLYPVDYSLFLALAIISTYRQAFPAGSLLRYIALMPFIAAGFDLLENACSVILLSTYPAQPALIAQLAGCITFLKWVFVVLSVVLALISCAASRLRR
jgi:hypothetical protein